MPGSYTAHIGPDEDVTGRVLDGRTTVTASYGRDSARALSPMRLGEAAFELDNSSRDYSPENAGSPLAGMVEPGREVLGQASLAGTTYTWFRGQIDDFKIKPGVDDRSVAVSCLDAVSRLRGVTVSTDMYQGLRTGEAIGRILDAAGWPADLRDLDAGATTMAWWWLDGADAYDALMELVDSEGPAALLTADGDGRIVFRDRHHRLIRTRSRVIQSTWRASGQEPCISPPAEYNHGWKEIINSVTFEVPVRVPSGVVSELWKVPGRISLSPGETVALQVKASTPFVGAIVPQEIEDYLLTGTVEITMPRTGGESTTVYIKAVGAPAAVDGLRVRGYALETVTTAVVTVEDPASISRYGRRSSTSLRRPVWAGVHDAKAIAELIVGRRASRVPTITVTMGGNDVRLLEQLSRDLSDRVHVVEPHTGLDAPCWIEQISHAITQGGLDHKTTFGLEKATTPVANPFSFNKSGAGFDQGAYAGFGVDNPATVLTFDRVGQAWSLGAFGT